VVVCCPPLKGEPLNSTQADEDNTFIILFFLSSFIHHNLIRSICKLISQIEA